jgi:hypothetical protein
MRVTIADLEKPPRGEKACEDARMWFAEEFPKGCTKAQAIAACPRGDWLIWGLWNFKLATIEQIIMAGCAAGRLSLRFAREQDRKVCVAAFDAADAVADNNTEQTRAAACAADDAAWSAAWSAACAADDAAWSAACAADDAAWSAAWSAACAAGAAAGAAAWSAACAADDAGAAGAAAGAAEHLACADAIRKLMRTARYKRRGRRA